MGPGVKLTRTPAWRGQGVQYEKPVRIWGAGRRIRFASA
jgi:hypothetical protein